MFKARHSQTCPGTLVAVVEEEKQEEEEGRKNTFTRKRGSQHYPSGQTEGCSDTGWRDGRVYGDS